MQERGNVINIESCTHMFSVQMFIRNILSYTQTRFFFIRQNNTIVDTVLSAPRSSYLDVVNLTDKQVQNGNFSDMRVVPGYYTVASDRGERL